MQQQWPLLDPFKESSVFVAEMRSVVVLLTCPYLSSDVLSLLMLLADIDLSNPSLPSTNTAALIYRIKLNSLYISGMVGERGLQ